VRTDPGATSGNWEPVEPDWGDVRLTVELTEPVTARPFEDVPIGDYVDQADQWTGEVVDVDPILGEGSFRCEADRLVLSPGGDAGITWTLTRA
jgi:hypothetical protein